jgi:hypothetical protein
MRPSTGPRRRGPLLVPSRMVFKGAFGDEKAWRTEDLQLTDFVLR